MKQALLLLLAAPLFAQTPSVVIRDPSTVGYAAGVTSGGALKTDASATTQPVSGTFWQATQPVSGTFWQATQPVSGTFWQATQPVSGTFWQTTQPVSAASLPLPSGAATSANQSAGTAGSASSVVESIQGIASMTPVNINATQLAGNTLVNNPCQTTALTFLPVSEATSSLATIITGTSAKHTYLCSIVLISNTAQNINLISGTGTNCGTASNGGLFGGTTNSTGLNVAANGGFALGNGGYPVARDNTAADNICYYSSSTGQVSGAIMYVQQ